MQVRYSVLLLCCSLANATISIKRTGWLNRLVEYHKIRFLEDIEKLAPIQINASIERIPPGYVDSPNWNYESVIRLLTLIKESKTAKPVRIALRRMLAPSRRFMSKNQSYKYFPSLQNTIIGDFYYDSNENLLESIEMVHEEGLIMVSNPVEARLPSGQISIKLLKEIMEARAVAAREMPKISKAPIDWIEKDITTIPPSPDGGGGDDAGGADTTGGDAGGGDTTGGDAGAGDTTSGGATGDGGDGTPAAEPAADEPTDPPAEPTEPAPEE